MSKASAQSTHRLQQNLLKEPYARILIPEDDGTYSADILEFPGCHAEGDTPAEAIANLEKAASAWIDAAVEQGQEIPLPMSARGFSGKINLRLPKWIHKQAARYAQRDDISLNQFFISAIAARVGAEEFCDHLARKFERQVVSTARVVTFQVFPVAILQPTAPFQTVGSSQTFPVLSRTNFDLQKVAPNA